MSIDSHRGLHVGICETTGKRKFTDRRRAKRAARSTGRGLSAYLCEHCDMWHLGHRQGMTREQHRQLHQRLEGQ